MELPIPRRHRRTSIPGVLALVAGLLVAACSGGGAAVTSTPDPAARCATAPAAPAELEGWPATGSVATTSVFPLVVSSELVCGANRVIFGFLDRENRLVTGPEQPAGVAFYDLAADPATPVAQVDAQFVWAIEGERGLYVATVDLPRAGTWGAEFRTRTASGGTEGMRMRLEVSATGSAVRVGDRAPSVATPTLADVGDDVARISSDTDPRPAFYETSVDAALASGTSFVLVFATPAFCTSAQCGPLLDVVKRVADTSPATTIINVEPYRLKEVGGRVQPDLDANGEFQPAEATEAYGILAEPWIYVVDGSGVVRASFEGVVDAAELTAAIATAP